MNHHIKSTLRIYSSSIVIWLVILLLTLTGAHAQELFVQMGTNLSTIEHYNSEGQKMANLFYTPNSTLGVGVRQPLRGNFLSSFGLSYSGYGAIGSHMASGSYLKWDLNVAEVKVGIEYTVLKTHAVSFLIKAASSFSFLVYGTQTIAGQVYHLNAKEEFPLIMNNGFIGVGVAIPLTKDIRFYSDYYYSRTLNMKEPSSEEFEAEKMRILSHQIVFGLVVRTKPIFFKRSYYRRPKSR